jgi:hypothetical protein
VDLSRCRVGSCMGLHSALRALKRSQACDAAVVCNGRAGDGASFWCDTVTTLTSETRGAQAKRARLVRSALTAALARALLSAPLGRCHGGVRAGRGVHRRNIL